MVYRTQRETKKINASDKKQTNKTNNKNNNREKYIQIIIYRTSVAQPLTNSQRAAGSLIDPTIINN